MKLRALEKKDSELMLEWMHDKSVVEWLNADFKTKTIEDCWRFVELSKERSRDLHLAVVNDEDEYMGTVSLKHINSEAKNAEFAITVRASAMGKGFSKYAMEEIARIGFQELGLQSIYWCVSEKNVRAVRFYEKSCGKRTNDVPDYILKNYDEEMLLNLIWYKISA